ncbi:MAG: metallophosphoesterase [Actinomycetota bacterium]
MYRPLGWAAAAGAGLAAYALLEPYRYRLVTHELPVRWDGPPLDVLHLADTHLSPRDTRLMSFLKELPDRLPKMPDLVVATGDMIEGDAGIAPLLESIAGIEARYGRFYVFGSHDYYVSSGPSYTKYFSSNKTMRRAVPTDWDRLEDGLRSKGWIALTNSEHTLEIGGATVRLAGVDDPYLKRHDTHHIHRERADDLAIALVHAPDVVSEWILNGFDLVVAGHTHAGQVRAPFVGALVTNCSLPSALASGPSRVGAGWLHVSPGLGTGRYSPIRFLARPEATLLRLLPAR